MNEYLAAALRYADRGWPVFPCSGKTPLTRNGFKDAVTSDSGLIEGWWRSHRDANVGVATGRGSGLLVLDVDGDAGADALHALEREHGELPRTASVKTPGGGSHYYFRHPAEPIRGSAGKLGPGLDIRADDGYVIAPPSRGQNGRRYEVDESAPVAEPPGWLLDLIRESSARRAGAAPVGDVIPEGTRNGTLASLAGTMRRRGMGEVEMLAALNAANRTRCQPPLPDDEVAAIAASVGRYPPASNGGGGEREPPEPKAEGLPWRWGDELADAAPDEPDWILGDYFAVGEKVTFAGLPKVGKTTLIASLIGAIAGGEPTFLGRTIKGGPVLLASEEGDGTLAPKLKGLPPERVRVLNRDAVWPKPPWSELIADATREAQRIGAVVLVIDSMAFWAAFEPERENDAGAAQAIMDALDQACRTGLAILLIHHQRKQPGASHGTGVRGSGALTGAPDVIVEFERLGEDAPRTQRRLVALSRHTQTPEVLVIDRDRQDGSWRVVGIADDRVG